MGIPHRILNRSKQMARIRAKDTRPELLLRRMLWGLGYRYRLQYRTPGGRADLAFVGKRVAVFLDGCFWHGCPEHYVPPRSSRAFWARKLRDNVSRDQRQARRLEEAGWLALRFWEHEVFESPDSVARQVRQAVTRRRSLAGERPRVVAVDFLDREGLAERRWLESLMPVRDLGSVVRERSTSKWNRRS